MDFNKLSNGDKVIGGGAIVFLISMFLPWFTFDTGFGSASANGFDVGFLWGLLPLLLAVVMAGVVILDKLTEVELPELPIPPGLAMLILGGVAVALVTLKLAIGETFLSRSFGIFLAFLAAAALAGGGFLKFQEDGSQTTTGGGGGGSTPPQSF